MVPRIRYDIARLYVLGFNRFCLVLFGSNGLYSGRRRTPVGSGGAEVLGHRGEHSTSEGRWGRYLEVRIQLSIGRKAGRQTGRQTGGRMIQTDTYILDIYIDKDKQTDRRAGKHAQDTMADRQTGRQSYR